MGLVAKSSDEKLHGFLRLFGSPFKDFQLHWWCRWSFAFKKLPSLHATMKSYGGYFSLSDSKSSWAFSTPLSLLASQIQPELFATAMHSFQPQLVQRMPNKAHNAVWTMASPLRHQEILKITLSRQNTNCELRHNCYSGL